MCKAFEEVRNEGIEYGEQKKALQIAIELIKLGSMKLETIADTTGLTIDRIRQLAAAME